MKLKNHRVRFSDYCEESVWNNESHASLLAEKIANCILLQRFFEELRGKILKPIKVSPNLEKPYVFCYLRVLCCHKACFESQLLNSVWSGGSLYSLTRLELGFFLTKVDVYLIKSEWLSNLTYVLFDFINVLIDFIKPGQFQGFFFNFYQE